MVDKMVMLELVVLAVVLSTPCVRTLKSEQDVMAPYQTFSCYTDHCNVDRLEFCSHREKRCIGCSQHMGHCQNPERAARMPSECIIYCRKHLQYEEQMKKAAQAWEDKMEEMQQNIYTSEGLETTTKQYQTGCPPSVEIWVVILVGIVAVLGWGILIFLRFKRYRETSSSKMGATEGTSSATRRNARDEECHVEMTELSNGDLKGTPDTDCAPSGFGSKSTTFTKSEDSGLGEPRMEKETVRKAVPISEVWRNIEDVDHGLLSHLNNLVEKGENGSEQPQSQGRQLRRGQRPLRQQDEEQEGEEEQRLLGPQHGNQDNQQQQSLWDPYGPQSPQGRGETSTDVSQRQRSDQIRRGVPPESDSSILRSCSVCGARSGCLANAGTSPQASAQCQFQPACCPAYKKLTQVNPTNNT